MSDLSPEPSPPSENRLNGNEGFVAWPVAGASSPLSAAMCLRNALSTMPLTRLEVSSDEPGGNVTLTCAAPSSNGGRKSVPRLTTSRPLPAMAVNTANRISFRPHGLMLKWITGVTARFKKRSRKLSAL